MNSAISGHIYTESSMNKKENTVFTQLVPCIVALQKIRIYYKGLNDDPADWRDIDPYLIGENKNGRIVLSAYFYPNDGQRSSGQVNGWKTYFLSNILSIELTEDSFDDDRPEFNRQDKRMKTVICCIP